MASAAVPRELAVASDLKKTVGLWIREARAQGWTVEKGRQSSHWKWRNPSGELVYITASTPSGSVHQLHRMRGQLRKAGLDILKTLKPHTSL